MINITHLRTITSRLPRIYTFSAASRHRAHEEKQDPLVPPV